jgi:hypothetical protein
MDEDEDSDGHKAKDSDVEELDFNNFKGIYFNDDPNRKYQDPETGCHFEYNDLCRRLVDLKALRKEIDKELGLPLTPKPPAAVLSERADITKQIKVKKTNDHVLKIHRNMIKEHVPPGLLIKQAD